MALLQGIYLNPRYAAKARNTKPPTTRTTQGCLMNSAATVKAVPTPGPVEIYELVTSFPHSFIS